MNDKLFHFFSKFIKTRYMCVVAATVILLILSSQNIFAQSGKKSEKILNAARIYKPNTTFLYKAVYDSSGSVQTAYVLMRILPEVDYGEIAILYDYYKNIPEVNGDSIVNVEDKIPEMGPEGTRLTDNKKYIDIHPPRWGKYYLSQYFPFPHIKLPVKEGKKSKGGIFSPMNAGTKRTLCINDSITTRKHLWLKYNMRNSVKFQYQYKDNLIDVYEKKGKAISHTGEYTASYLFNENLGFVKWNLSSSNNVSLEFTLLDTYPFLLKNDMQIKTFPFRGKDYWQNYKTKE